MITKKNEGVNTRMNYMYRDASNYKNHGHVIFSGIITADLEKKFIEALEDGQYFIAEQVDVETVFFEGRYEDDHCWHEFNGFKITDMKPTDPRTIEEFVEQVVATDWKCDESGPSLTPLILVS